MSQSKQAPHDSYTIFLRNVRKRHNNAEPVVDAEKLDLEILQDLETQGPMSVQDLVGAHGLSITETVRLLGQLQKADMLTVDTKTDIVTLTEFGHHAAKLQGLATRND